MGSKFKDVRGEQIILIVKKSTRQSLDHKVNVRVFNNKEKGIDGQPSILVPQKSFDKLNKFLTFDNEKCYELIAKIEKSGDRLNDFVDGEIFRGLPIGGNRIDRNLNCGHSTKVIRGKNIKKFSIKDPYLISDEMLEKQSKAKINLLLHKKVVLQNIYSSEAGVIAAFDKEGILSLDTVTNIVVDSDNQGAYVLALLNSKLINFYLTYAMFGRSRLTMHLDKSYVGQVPVVKKLKSGRLNRIMKIVHSATGCDDNATIKERNKELDEVVYDIYGLKKNEINTVENAMSQILSEKSRW